MALTKIEPALLSAGAPTWDSSGNVAVTGNLNVGGNVLGAIKSGTAVASTSGTAIDFTNIPATAKRITIMFAGVSLSGSAALIIRIGSGSVDATGYLGTGSAVSTGVVSQNSTTGFVLNGGSSGAGEIVHGSVSLTLVNAATNAWSAFGGVGRSDGAQMYFTTGSKSLSGTLDRVRITSTNGTDLFDAGSINILWE